MEKKYKCEMCGSESTNTPDTCCGKIREEKVVESKMENTEHNHKEGEKCPSCNIK